VHRVEIAGRAAQLRRSIGAVAAAAALASSAGTAWPATAVPQVPAWPYGGWVASLNPGTGRPASAIAPSTISACAKVAAKAGFSFTQTVNTRLGPEPRIAVAVSIAMAESSCALNATNHDSNGSQDRGLWQINNAAWPGISNSCAFQMQCNANAAFTISGGGSNWNPWATYGNGAWQRYISSAISAIGSGFVFQLADQAAGTCAAADPKSGADGAPIRQATCDATDTDQQWRFATAPGRMPVLQNVGQSSCLGTDADADGMAKGPGKPVVQRACDNTNASEQWSFTGSGVLNNNGNAEAGLRNNADGTCLAADPKTAGDGGVILEAACTTGNGYQQWN
jgi:Lysozyme like domain/Ricin-type beta-trefoil lectin domain